MRRVLSRGIFLAIPLPNSGTLGHARVYGQVSTLEQVGVAMPLTNFQDLEQTMTPSDPISPTTNRQPPIAPFLRAMLDILMKEDQTIVRWTADGNAFEIVDMDGLTEYLLPKYFKHNRYQSFQRQLNYFGFRKWTKSQAVLCTFSNKHFTRHKPDDVHLIKRKNKAERPRKRKASTESFGHYAAPTSTLSAAWSTAWQNPSFRPFNYTSNPAWNAAQRSPPLPTVVNKLQLQFDHQSMALTPTIASLINTTPRSEDIIVRKSIATAAAAGPLQYPLDNKQPTLQGVGATSFPPMPPAAANPNLRVDVDLVNEFPLYH